MQRVALIAKLKPDTSEEVADLVSGGPPFDPRAAGVERHTVFLAEDEVVFVFEGGSPDALGRLLGEGTSEGVVAAWAPLLDGMPRVAREVFAWTRPADALAAGWED